MVLKTVIEQAALFKEADEKTKKAAEEGKPEPRYVVAMAWWKEFQAYINPDDAAAHKPGKIYNDDLAVDDQEGGVQTLGAAAELDRDYTIVGKSVWDTIVALYALSYNTPTFLYKKLTSGAEAAVLIGEVEYQLVVCEDNGKPGQDTFKFSVGGLEPLSKVVSEAADTAHKEVTKWTFDEGDGLTYVRLWARPRQAAADEPDDAWVMLPMTDAAGLATASHEYWAEHWPAAGCIPELMVEARKHGFWLRENADQIALVKAMKEKQAAVEAMDDATWRAQLSVGDYCDVKANVNGKDKWREAEVVADDGDSLSVNFRGMR